MAILEHQRNYIMWQNRAIDFYLASRKLWEAEIFAPSAFCGQQALENLLKATLFYYDPAFEPRTASHNLKKMVDLLHQKVATSQNLEVPDYFYYDRRMQSVTRYPDKDRGVLIPGTMLCDLDNTIAGLIALVPFQFNSNLKRILRRDPPGHYHVLAANNESIHELKRILVRCNPDSSTP